MLLPLLSIFLFALMFNVDNSNATGLAVLVPRPIETVDATLSLTIEEDEFIPIDSDIQIRYDSQLASLPLGHLLVHQKTPAAIVSSENAKLNYAGKGIHGPYTLTFRLSDFITDAAVSSSPIIITLLYKTQVLTQTSSQLKPKE